MNRLYECIGISKQAVHQYHHRQLLFDSKISQLLLEAEELRQEHPGCGVEKMYYTLNPDFIGRDRFIEVMMQLGFRIKRKKNYKRTTIPTKEFYPNLIKGKKVNGPGQVWQSDITYFPMGGKHYYGVFIIDVYTKEIVGYQISDHMRATANMKALNMALKYHSPPEIHHSDRGSQYTYKGYTEHLETLGCKLSMALSAQDNAYAERIHRTLKEEYLDHWKPETFEQLKRCVAKAVKNYNHKRIHNHINRTTPSSYKSLCKNIKAEEREVITIFNNENLNQKPVNAI